MGKTRFVKIRCKHFQILFLVHPNNRRIHQMRRLSSVLRLSRLGAASGLKVWMGVPHGPDKRVRDNGRSRFKRVTMIVYKK
jgi:hypothetical protein